MNKSTKGIHHISIISGEPQRNAEFYVNTLGLRFVMKSVNQDDPGNYHLFYANRNGDTGSSITFFPWPKAVRAEYGSGETVAISFMVPDPLFSFWKEHLKKHDIEFEEPIKRFNKNVLRFHDPDGLPLELVEDSPKKEIEVWEKSSIPAEYQIRGFWSATLRLNHIEETANILEEVLGFRKSQEEGNFTLMETDSIIGHSIILEKTDQAPSKRTGRGTVHHVAFRAKDEHELSEMRDKVLKMGLHPTEILDRHVFKSVYYRTPGGVLFEMATDGPGYGVAHNSEEEMGKKLFLPPWMESKRRQIEKALTPIKL